MLSSAPVSYLTSSSPLWVAGRALLAKRCFELFACWNKAGRTLNHDAIQDLRSASRRVQECVLLFEPCYRGDDIARFGKKLSRLTRRLGAISSTGDTLLFMEKFSGELSPHQQESSGALLDQLRQRREVQTRKVGGFLRKTRRHSLADLFKELNKSPDLFGATAVDPFMPVRRYLRSTLLPTLTEMGSLAAAGRCESASEAQHAWMSALSRLRYRLEIVTPVMLKGAPEPVTEILRRYQELLERVHALDLYLELVKNMETDAETLEELVGILTSKRSRLWIRLETLVEEQPWERLAARIEECL